MGEAAMKRMILAALVGVVMFSSTSFAEWKKVSKNVNGTAYVDFERIKKHDEYVHFWQLTDYLKPSEQEILSIKKYIQGDCKKFRYEWLNFWFYKEPMGEGNAGGMGLREGNEGWKYPLPDTSIETVLKAACQHAGM
jgi:hypothetical protein